MRLVYSESPKLVYVESPFRGRSGSLTRGMELGIERARSIGRPVQWMSLRDWSDSWLPDGVDRNEWRRMWREGDQVT